MEKYSDGQSRDVAYSSNVHRLASFASNARLYVSPSSRPTFTLMSPLSRRRLHNTAGRHLMKKGKGAHRPAAVVRCLRCRIGGKVDLDHDD